MAALAVGPEHQVARVAISFPILLLFMAQSWYRQWDIQWGHRYAMECLSFAMMFDWIDRVLLSNPDREGWYKIHYGKGAALQKEKDETANGKMNGNGKAVAPRKRYEIIPGGAGTTFWSRMWWGARLSVTNRYVGWSCQVKNINMEVPSDYPRLLFIARKTLRLAIFYICNDIIVCHSAASPYGTFEVLEKSGQKFVQLLPADPAMFHIRFWYAWVQIIICFVNLEIMHTLYAIISVSSGLANPRDCPSGFGRLRDLWSVRQAWSSVWHQQCRRLCAAPSLWLARNGLGLKKGSFASKYVQLFAAFTITGAVHAFGSMMIAHSWDDTGSWRFFLTQAAIIMVEDHVIALGKKLGCRDSARWRLLGFVWVVLIMGCTFEDYFRHMVRQKVWVHGYMPDFFGIGPKRP
ncbi:hypothetical protein ACJQWK_11215 [Exserohilum turcicum]